MTQRHLWLLDPGHGIDTPGKRSPDGSLREYEFNRAIAWRMLVRLTAKDIAAAILVPEIEDVPLSDRVRRADAFVGGGLPPIVVSIHANAGGGTGWEVWTSPGETDSDKIATVFYDEAGALPGLGRRHDYTDGDPDKESRFTILTRTKAPAVLVEHAFMDTEHDLAILKSRTGRDAFVACNVDAIVRIEKEGIPGP
jgi:N-acetylmuramoyl-L-alanine amidase